MTPDQGSRRRVFTFVEGMPSDKPASEKAQQLDDLMTKFDPEGKLRAPAGVTAEQTLGGLLAWAKQWMALPSNDDERILLIWNNGISGEKAATFVAAADPEAFLAVLAMAAPRDWFKL